MIRALVAEGQHAQARKEIVNRVSDSATALALSALVSAHEGNQARFNDDFAQYQAAFPGDLYWPLSIAAWGGDREFANTAAAKIDQHPFGAVTLALITSWCGCGAPFDLDAAPTFAAKLRDGGPAWPPPPALNYPLKTW